MMDFGESQDITHCDFHFTLESPSFDYDATKHAIVGDSVKPQHQIFATLDNEQRNNGWM